MTIVYTDQRRRTLSQIEWIDNPFFTPASLGGAYSTTTGTETEAASNAATNGTFDPWVATVLGAAAALTIDLGSAQSPTFAGIVAHNLQGATVTLQSSADNISYTDIAAITPIDNNTLGWRFEGITARYWRFAITGATGSASIGHAGLFNEIIMPQRFYSGYTPPITPTDVENRANVTEGGHYISSAYVERGSSVSGSIQHLTPDFLRGDTWTDFQRAWNKGRPAFYGWRPNRWSDDLLYIWRRGAPMVPTNSGPKQYMSVSFEARAYHV